MKHQHHKIFLGVSSIVVLLIGILFSMVINQSASEQMTIIIILGLMIANTVTLLMIGGVVFEIRDFVENKQAKRGGKKK